MTEKERELILSWIVNEESRLDDELVHARNRVRWSRPDMVDIMDFIACLQRYSDFRDFALVIIRLLNLDLR